MDQTKVTPDSERVSHLIEKIREMSERGDDHERQVATSKLERIYKKYNISNKSAKSKKEFKIHNSDESLRILSQCIWSVCGDIEIQFKGKKAYAIIEPIQFIEVCEKYNFYWQLYGDQKEQFFKAFIIKNELVAKSSKNGINQDEALKIGKIMNGIDKGVMPKKQLTNNK